jgi:K+-sensing histidine kinase KdpD
MVKKRLKNPLFLFYILVGYIIVQSAWWLYLIFKLYKGTYLDQDILSHKSWMLIGEGGVFMIILFGGVYSIRKAIKREKKVNNLQENFLQSVSHELKTPISSVALFLETLKKRELSDEKRNEIYDHSLMEIERLNNLISDILTARNIESDNYFINKVSLNLKEHIENRTNVLKETILKNHLVVTDLQEMILDLDREAMDGILYNLFENAAKYAPDDSTVTIKLFAAGTKNILQVIDEGDGIKAENRNDVFNKFHRVENETTRKSKGTGLGLYITKFLVEQQGGNITLKHNKPTGLIVEIQF